MNRCLLSKKSFPKTRVSKRLQAIQSMIETPPSLGEISEPNTNKNAGPDYLHSSSRIANEGNSNYDSAENQDTTMHDISTIECDECVVHERPSNTSRISKRQRAIASMSQSPISMREIGETSAQDSKPKKPRIQKKTQKSSSPVVLGPCYDTPAALQVGKKKKTQTKKAAVVVLKKQTVKLPRVRKPNEVAAIWPDDTSSSESNGPYITVRGRSEKSHRIYHNYGCYDPLQYPLLFPKGDCGWGQGLKKNDGQVHQQSQTEADPVLSKAVHTEEDVIAQEACRLADAGGTSARHVSPREYYAYKLQCRPNNMLLRAGRCLQQYIVDMYVKIENTRLDYFRHNQQKIRADLYQGVLDSIQDGETNAINIGRRVILPPTFIDGPRDMKRRYLNAMALVQRFGKPDLFVTMTCNANWPEIKDELAPGELAQNQPDLVARIFRAKLLCLKQQIMKKHTFGKVAAMIYVIEFQKRGLPHAHFLIILKPEYKMKTPSDFDRFVSAELPPHSSPQLRKIVVKHMMHGPCGERNPKCPCMVTKKNNILACKYGYPKSFLAETANHDDGYPMYRRRDSGERVRIRGAYLDNRSVIPYNPYLSSLFDCHLNVEICSSIQAVKYLYKYVYKGHDRVSFNVNGEDHNSVDEIDRFQSGRWVSPCEAVWRIFGFDLFEMYPPVQHLPMHLENMQTVHLRNDEQLNSDVLNERRSKTQLTEFFKANAASVEGTGYLYSQFIEHNRWDSSAKAWFQRRNKNKVIGRLETVTPAEGGRFFLRLLLINVLSPKSFIDLRTVNGVVCPTFQEACIQRGLFEEDNVVFSCLTEAAEIQMPSALRRLFAAVLVFCRPRNPDALWLQFYNDLSDDYRHTLPQSEGQVRLLTIQSIERHLESMGKSLAHFQLEHLHEEVPAELNRTKDIIDALDAPIPQQCIDCRQNLNVAQQIVFDKIISHVLAQKPGCFFVDGPGGTGKTFLYNALYAEVRLAGKIVLPTATSGIAAANIPSGRTAHSRFKIPLDFEISLACDVPKQGSLAALLKETALIIWDEASMARKQNIESVDLLLRDLYDLALPFGGKVIVFGGDFRQVLPVVPQKTQREAVATSLVNSRIWPWLEKMHLTENIRAKEDPTYASFLLSLGNGELQSSENSFVQVPSHIVSYYRPTDEPIQHLAAFAFLELNHADFSPAIFRERAILTPLNDAVDSINAFLIDKFPGEPTIYRSFDSILDDNCAIYPTEFLNQLAPSGMTPHELVLKVNSPVILLRNIDPADGLCNGTRLICKYFRRNVIVCSIALGHRQGELVFIHRVNLRPPSSTKYPIQFERIQFPLKLSFAMTINKAQGQTLSQVLVYLPQPCFSHGQLYVALSRAKKSNKVTVITPQPTGKYTGTVLKNIIAYDVLQLAGIT